MLSPQRVSPDQGDGVAPGALSRALLASVFVIAACGLVYELVAGAAASYLLGDSVTQFSLVIGTYLSAMGVGSYLSRYILSGLVARFFEIELAIALLGGLSATAMFIAFAHLGESFRWVLFGFVVVIGVLVGLEIPLVMRILRDRLGFRELVATVLSFDYLGALAVSLAFPLVLAPRLGLIRTAFLFGLMNALVAAWALWLFRAQLRPFAWRAAQVALVVAVLGAGLAGADRLTTFAEEELYADRILHAQTTRYQRIVVTKWRDDVRLFLNGNLQFSSADEYRYHEALVHPALAALPAARRVLVLGGGDGMAVREILRYPQIESVTLVDLDPEMTRLFASVPLLRALNQDAFASPKVKVVNADAFKWLEQSTEHFDFVDRRLSRPEQLLARQALHQCLLPDARAAPLGARRRRHPVDLAALRPALVLVRRRDDRSGGTQGDAVPRAGAVVRRVGVRHRLARAVHAAGALPAGAPLPHARHRAGAVPLPEGHGPRPGRGQPPQQPGAGAVLRGGVEAVAGAVRARR